MRYQDDDMEVCVSSFPMQYLGHSKGKQRENEDSQKLREWQRERIVSDGGAENWAIVAVLQRKRRRK